MTELQKNSRDRAAVRGQDTLIGDALHQGNAVPALPVKGGLNRADMGVLGLVLVFIFGFFLWLTFAQPRPFTVMENDLENEFFYNSLALRDGFYVQGGGHPGTPARYAYLLLFSMFGIDTGPSWQSAMNLGYAAICLLVGVAAITFYFLVRRLTPPSTALLALACALTTAPALHHLNHFGSDALILPFGLVLVGLVWSVVADHARPRLGRLACISALCGLCLSTKLTFVPLVMLVLVVLSIVILCRRAEPFPSRGRRVAQVAALWGGVGLVHVMVCLPMQNQLPDLWLATLSRSEALPVGSWLSQLLRGVSGFSSANPILAVATIIICGLALYRASCRLFRGGLAGLSSTAAGFLWVVGGVFCLLYGYSVSGWMVGGFSDAGAALRYAGPLLLVIPTLVLMAVPDGAERSSRMSFWIVSLAFAVMASSTAIHLIRRSAFLEAEVRRSTLVTARLDELRVPGTRIAFWDRASGASFGEATFRLWGNYRWYRQKSYDEETLARFPGYTFFRLREIRSINTQASSVSSAAEQSSVSLIRSGMRSVWRTIMQCRIPGWFPPRDVSGYYTSEGGRRVLFTGEEAGLRVSLVAYPKHDEERERVTGTEIVDAVSSRLGPVNVWEETFGDEVWVLLQPVEGQRGRRTEVRSQRSEARTAETQSDSLARHSFSEGESTRSAETRRSEVSSQRSESRGQENAE